MTASVTVSGTSDDCIEIAGDFAEEFPWQKRGYGQPSGDLLAFSDGTILRIEFTDAGVWRIELVAAGTATLFIEQAPENDEDNYTDKATLTGEISWVVQGIDYAPKGH